MFRPRWWENIIVSLNRGLFPGLLGGVAAGDWLRLLSENDFAVDPAYLPRALLLTLSSLATSVQRRVEIRTYGQAVAATAIRPPLFLLGHWRAGTTHLHNLLAVDPQFAFPNSYQAVFAHTFLSTESMAAPAIASLVTERRPMDNVRVGLDLPQEDEFALNALTLCSPYMGWAFSSREQHYDRYLTFRGVPEAEVRRWKEGFVFFLKKLTWKYGRPLVLKSPPHTARIRLLLELFPDARFLHIHRNPYHVFQSTRHTNLTAAPVSAMRRRGLRGLDEAILQRYQVMHEAFFAERGLIPAGRFHEISYEDLETDPVGQVQGAYERLGLPDFEAVRPALRRYVDAEANYRKNKLPELPEPLRRRIAQDWRRSFEEWGYAAE